MDGFKEKGFEVEIDGSSARNFGTSGDPKDAVDVN